MSLLMTEIGEKKKKLLLSNFFWIDRVCLNLNVKHYRFAVEP